MRQEFFSYFQFICLVFFLFIFVGRTLYLRVHRNSSATNKRSQTDGRTAQ